MIENTYPLDLLKAELQELEDRPLDAFDEADPDEFRTLLTQSFDAGVLDEAVTADIEYLLATEIRLTDPARKRLMAAARRAIGERNLYRATLTDLYTELASMLGRVNKDDVDPDLLADLESFDAFVTTLSDGSPVDYRTFDPPVVSRWVTALGAPGTTVLNALDPRHAAKNGTEDSPAVEQRLLLVAGIQDDWLDYRQKVWELIDSTELGSSGVAEELVSRGNDEDGE